MPECNNEQQCCPPDSLGYKSCESDNLFSASVTETFVCVGQPDVILTGRGVSSVSQGDADAKAAADLTLQLAIYRILNPCGCTDVTQPDLVACGVQDWLPGPESGIPYANTGDNVTGWTNITQGDWTSDGVSIQNTPGNTVCDLVNGIISDGFSMTGQIEVRSSEANFDNYCAWILTDANKQRSILLVWSPITGSPAFGFQVLAACDLAGDFFTNTFVSSATTALSPNVVYNFTFSYVAGVLTLTVDTESVSIDLGCAVFGYIALAGVNEVDDNLNLTNINIS